MLHVTCCWLLALPTVALAKVGCWLYVFDQMSNYRCSVRKPLYRCTAEPLHRKTFPVMKTKLSLNNVFDFLKTHGSGVETPKLGVSTRLLFLFLALSPVPCALSQVPQGYNYQAVASNASGVPIASHIPVSKNDHNVRFSWRNNILAGASLFSNHKPSGSNQPG